MVKHFLPLTSMAKVVWVEEASVEQGESLLMLTLRRARIGIGVFP